MALLPVSGARPTRKTPRGYHSPRYPLAPMARSALEASPRSKAASAGCSGRKGPAASSPFTRRPTSAPSREAWSTRLSDHSGNRRRGLVTFLARREVLLVMAGRIAPVHAQLLQIDRTRGGRGRNRVGSVAVPAFGDVGRLLRIMRHVPVRARLLPARCFPVSRGFSDLPERPVAVEAGFRGPGSSAADPRHRCEANHREAGQRNYPSHTRLH
jgi:hypothetical protein